MTVTYSNKINFPAKTKNWHNRATVLYTKYVRNTKNYFPLDPKTIRRKIMLSKFPHFSPELKTDTTQQHNWKKGSSSPCKASVFVSPSVILSISKGYERDVE